MFNKDNVQIRRRRRAADAHKYCPACQKCCFSAFAAAPDLRAGLSARQRCCWAGGDACVRVRAHVCVHTVTRASSVAWHRYGLWLQIASLLSFGGFPDCLEGQALQARLGQSSHCVPDSSQLVGGSVCLISLGKPCEWFACAPLGSFPVCEKYKVCDTHSSFALNPFD